MRSQNTFRLAATMFVLASSMPADAASIGYMLTSSKHIGAINFGTATYTDIGSETFQLAGLGSTGGALYGGSGSTLYQIDLTTGALTSIGASGFTYADMGSTPGGGLFAVDTADNLYSVNAATGAGTLIGATGLTLGTIGDISLSNDSDVLYYSDQNVLYSLNTTTGAPTVVDASLGVANRAGQSVGIEMGGLALVNGMLLGGETFPGNNQIWTISTSGGTATVGSLIAGSSTGIVDGWALISGTSAAAPEPGSLALVLIGLGLASVMRRRLRV